MDLRQAQIDLETLASASARTRALEHFASSVDRGEAAAAAPVASMIRDALPKAAEGVSAMLLEADRRQRRRGEAAAVLSDMDPELLAFVGLNGFFTASISGQTLIQALQAIGTAVGVERWAQLTAKADPKKIKSLLKSGRTPARMPKDVQALARLIDRHGGAPLDWDADLLVVIGGELAPAVLDTGLFRLEEGEAGADRVLLTDEAADALEGLEVTLPWQRPKLMPMVCEPSGWRDPDEAPYLTEGCRRYLGVLGRTRGRQLSQVRYAWPRAAIKPFRRALDTLTSVPFRIDAQTVSAARWAWERGVAVENIPTTAKLAYAPPECPADDLTEDQRRLEWTKQREIRDTNVLNRVLGQELLKDLSLAEGLEPYPAIYQPHFADYRGRLYTASSFSHHRSDHVRSMFRFQRSAPLGEHGRRWLAIHLANCASGDLHGKLDKAPYEERVRWAESNGGLARMVADRWQEQPELWTQAGSPFQFLQAAREWAAMRSWERDNGDQGKGFQSSVIVGVDGTCSGLQHYAAALRSEEEGRLVNLVPGERPADVYAAVADRVVSLLGALAGGDSVDAEAAQRWLDFGISRSTVKRQVMTFAYSSELFGFRDQINDDIMRPIKRQLLEGRLSAHPFGDDAGAFAASLVLAKAIWQALQSVVVKSAEGMKWLKDTAGVLAKHKLGVEWTSPSGFPVVHRYMEGTEKQVGLTFGKTRVRVLTATNEGKTLVSHKQRSAMAPNFIHSQDAAHLHLTTVAMVERGVEDLAMIHDSFGTQAGNVELLQGILRQTFVKMYEDHDPFDEVHRYALENLPPEKHKLLAPPPAKGDLSIHAVLDSPYVFC